MGIEILIALLLGISAGTFTGIIPGIHINLVSAFLISILPVFQSVPPIALVIFIVSLSVTHSFIDFIPSIYLGAPDEDNFLSVLPGHQLLKEGLGHSAVVFTLYGSLISLLIIILFVPIFIYVLPVTFNAVQSVIPFILIFASLYLIFREERVISSLVIFLLAGFLGFAALNLPVKEPLLPLLTGLFGMSAIITSIKSCPIMPKQKILPLKKIILSKLVVIKSLISSAISAPLCSFLPGIGAGHAAVISSEIVEQDNKSFLFSIGSITTIVTSLNFVALYAIGKSRSGTAAAIKEIVFPLSKIDLTSIIITVVVTGLISFFIGIKISQFFARNISKISYKKVSIAVIAVLLIVNIYFTNWLGLIVLITSTALGTYTILSESRRINLMGCLLIPTILYYLF